MEMQQQIGITNARGEYLASMSFIRASLKALNSFLVNLTTVTFTSQHLGEFLNILS